MKTVITITIETDSGGSLDRRIREQTARLAKSDQSLADAVAAAGSQHSPTGDATVPTPPPKNKPGDPNPAPWVPTGNAAIDALGQQVTTDQTVIESAVLLINGIAAMITTAVNAAIAGGATPAQLAPLTALTASLTASDDALAAAVTANTPASP